MQYTFAVRTDVGRLRDNNEDAVLLDAANQLVVLADGMGGYAAGEVASAMAVDMISGDLVRWLAQAGADATLRDVRRAMEICVDNANRAIFDAANERLDYAGMGTTLVMALLHAGRIVLGHVGDSRAYRWRQERLEPITRDHSLLQEQLDVGLITAEEAAASGNRNLVTRALGVEDTVLLDVQDLALENGDVYLLCSDGLNDMVSDGEMAGLMAERRPLDELADALIACANRHGGRDNVTVALIQCLQNPKKSGVLGKLLRK